MKALDLPAPLHTVVSKAFAAAKQSESLVFSSTELAVIHTRQGVPVWTRSRHCYALLLGLAHCQLVPIAILPSIGQETEAIFWRVWRWHGEAEG